MEQRERLHSGGPGPCAGRRGCSGSQTQAAPALLPPAAALHNPPDCPPRGPSPAHVDTDR